MLTQQIFNVNRGSILSLDLVFPIDVRGKNLLFTATSSLSSDDSGAEIKKSIPMDSTQEVLTYNFVLAEEDTDNLGLLTLHCNFKIEDVGDSETFLIMIKQGPTTR